MVPWELEELTSASWAIDNKGRLLAVFQLGSPRAKLEQDKEALHFINRSSRDGFVCWRFDGQKWRVVQSGPLSLVLCRRLSSELVQMLRLRFRTSHNTLHREEARSRCMHCLVHVCEYSCNIPSCASDWLGLSVHRAVHSVNHATERRSRFLRAQSWFCQAKRPQSTYPHVDRERQLSSKSTLVSAASIFYHYFSY